jgi:uncharacterized 2Fe-2S/4Fe-4S cluster protein (DUF4445 family)
LEKKFDKKTHMGIAIDIGTTMIVFEIYDLQSNEKIAAHSRANAQRKYGADVIARISYANAGGLQNLRECVINDLQNGINSLIENCEKNFACEIKISKIVIAANTTMLHILQNFSCETLGVYPFAPVSVEMTREKFCEDCEVIILPGISAFVGADVVSGIFFCENKNAPSLLLDLGTNAEMALFGNVCDEILVTSAAMGPAFEGGNISAGMPCVRGAIARARLNNSHAGNVFDCETIDDAPPVGICGTGVVDICAEIIRHGLVDESGLLPGGDVEVSRNIFFTQKDIREIQLAKSAVRAGIEILLAEASLSYENIEKVFIAGGFGYKIDIQNAATLGLLPFELKDKVCAVGNAALGGAAKFLCGENENAIQKIANGSREINLAAHARFNELFLKHMILFRL